MIKISLLSFLSHLVLNAFGTYCDTQKQSSGSVILKHFAKFIEKLLCRSLFFYKVACRLEKRLQHVFPCNFARFFRTPILNNICERLLLVLVRTGLVWRAANLLMFCIIVCKSVFEVLRRSFQLILHWWALNQRTNVDNIIQVIKEVYLDIQTPARGNIGT